MTAAITIQTDRKDDALSVATSAVQTATDGSSSVRVLKNNKVIDTPVETGISSDTDTEITSGLSEGDTVITGTIAAASGSQTTGASPFSGLGGRGFGGGSGGGGARGAGR